MPDERRHGYPDALAGPPAGAVPLRQLIFAHEAITGLIAEYLDQPRTLGSSFQKVIVRGPPPMIAATYEFGPRRVELTFVGEMVLVNDSGSPIGRERRNVVDILDERQPPICGHDEAVGDLLRQTIQVAQECLLGELRIGGRLEVWGQVGNGLGPWVPLDLPQLFRPSIDLVRETVRLRSCGTMLFNVHLLDIDSTSVEIESGIDDEAPSSLGTAAGELRAKQWLIGEALNNLPRKVISRAEFELRGGEFGCSKKGMGRVWEEIMSEYVDISDVYAKPGPVRKFIPPPKSSPQ